MSVSNEFDIKTCYRSQVDKQLTKNRLQLDYLNYKGSELSPEFKINIDDYPEQDPDVRIFYFDIDNTLYQKSSGIENLMKESIYSYVTNELSIPSGTAKHIMKTYSQHYGLMVAGLVKNFNIDPMKYNMMVDDTLDIGDSLKINLKLRKLLLDMKSSNKIDKLWLCTNAYVNHALRCIKLLGIADLFDGITYVQYNSNREIICKPDPRFFERLKLESGLGDWKNAFFIDDSISNIRTASSLGMCKCFYVNEASSNDQSIGQIQEEKSGETETGNEEEEEENILPRNVVTINSILDLPKAEPILFI